MKINTIRTALAVLIGLPRFLWGSPEPLPHPEHPLDMDKITVREDVVLELRAPYPKILAGENPYFYLGIRNNTGQSLPVIQLVSFNSEDQILYEARGANSDLNLTRPAFIPDWQRLQQKIASGENRFDPLPPGGSRIHATIGEPFDVYSLRFNYFIFPTEPGLIRAALLVGENEWAFSSWIPVEYIEKRKLLDQPVVTTIYKGEGIYEHQIREAVIDGERYLFMCNPNNGTRIGRVPHGATPQVSVEGGGLDRKLVVSFAGVDEPPLILGFSKTEILRGTPQTAPQLEVLVELKRTLREKRESTSNPREVIRPPASTPTDRKPFPGAADERHGEAGPLVDPRYRLGLIGLLCILIVAMILWVKRR